MSGGGWRHHPRVRFTPELWAKWRAARMPNEHTVTLREGLEEFRALLAKAERRLLRGRVS
jgi:hypothetical protein